MSYWDPCLPPPITQLEWCHYVQEAPRNHLRHVPRKKYYCNTHFGHFSRWPPRIFAKLKNRLRLIILVSTHRFSRSANTMEPFLKWLDYLLSSKPKIIWFCNCANENDILGGSYPITWTLKHYSLPLHLIKDPSRKHEQVQREEAHTMKHIMLYANGTSVLCNQLASLAYNQEETDSRVILYCKYAQEQDYSIFRVRSPDSDIFILCLKYHSASIPYRRLGIT